MFRVLHYVDETMIFKRVAETRAARRLVSVRNACRPSMFEHFPELVAGVAGHGQRTRRGRMSDYGGVRGCGHGAADAVTGTVAFARTVIVTRTVIVAGRHRRAHRERGLEYLQLRTDHQRCDRAV